MKDWPIYLDYAAATPVDPRVVDVMLPYLTEAQYHGNASADHVYGEIARTAIATARAQVAQLLGAQANEIIFTSGATEANNLALFGVARLLAKRSKCCGHIITGATEHKAVLNVCAALEREGFAVTYLLPDANGVISVTDVAAACRPDTLLVSLMHINNETGVLTDVAAIAQLTREKNIVFHVDAAQSVGKIPFDLTTVPIDLLSMSSNKLYGPKGIGALYIRREPLVRLKPLVFGGDQEQSHRPGTLATHQIVGFGEACAIAQQEMQVDTTRLQKLNARLWEGLCDIPDIICNGLKAKRFPGIINVSIPHIDGEALVQKCAAIALTTGSACTNTAVTPSHVLTAMGVSPYLAHSSLRVSLGRFTSMEQVERAVYLIKNATKQLRALSPLWTQADIHYKKSTLESPSEAYLDGNPVDAQPILTEA